MDLKYIFGLRGILCYPFDNTCGNIKYVVSYQYISKHGTSILALTEGSEKIAIYFGTNRTVFQVKEKS